MNVRHVTGGEAVLLLDDPAFLAEWAALLAECPWATGFQAPHFARTWYAHYRERFAPHLALGHDGDGRLAGLLALGSAGRRRFVVVGDWQSEYHAWISRPEDGEAFAAAAVGSLDAARPLRFRYLPPGTPTRWLARPEFARRHALHAHPRPLYAIGDGSDARGSLRKSGNKKRLRLLAELGPVELRHVREPGEVAATFDTLIPLHDARHAAVRGSAPFRNDPLKRGFYIGLLRDPDLLHMSVLRAGGRIVAGHIGVRTGADLQFGLLAHDPAVSRASPGKFLIYHLAQRLAGEGFARFDLTAGGEGYKDRFANGGDTVHTLELYPTPRGRLAATLVRAAVGRARSAIEAGGISRDAAAVFAHSAFAIGPWLAGRGRLTARGRRPDAVGGLVAYHGAFADLPAPADPSAAEAPVVRRDDLAAMLDDAMPLSRWARRRFFSAAVRRMEIGQYALLASRDGRLTHLAWVEEAPPASVRPTLPCPAALVVWELRVAPGVDPAAATRALLAAVRDRIDGMPTDARVCVVVAAGDRGLRAALEALNFRVAGPLAPPASAHAGGDQPPGDATPRPSVDKKLVTTKKEQP